ncbi:MAG: hypothetical protein HYX47_17795 [Burkholderiales bacterium]|nr:hypothetical protein [Burkholderiales bacterium]
MTHPLRSFTPELLQRSLAAVVLCTVFGACAAEPSILERSQVAAVKYLPSELADWTHIHPAVSRVSGGELLLNGQQTHRSSLWSGWFGIGLARMANETDAAVRAKNPPISLVSVEAELNSAVARAVAASPSGKYLTQREAANNEILLTPSLFIGFLSATEVHPYVPLKARFQGPVLRQLWPAVYIAGVAGPVQMGASTGTAEAAAWRRAARATTNR